MGWWTGIPLWVRILAAMILGAALGFALQPQGPLTATLGLDPKPISDNLKLLGDAFVRLIRMISVPLIFVSVTAAVVSIGDMSKLGKSGVRVAALYIPSGLLAALIGAVVGLLLQPGAGASSVPTAEAPAQQAPPTLRAVVEQVITVNPVQSLASGDMLPIILFAILFGVGLLGAGQASDAATKAIEGAANAFIKLTGYIMELAPLGAFALMAWVTAVMGPEALLRLGALIGCVYLGCAAYVLIVYAAFLRFWVGLPVLPFFRGMAEPMAVAYATASSNATLPVTMRAMVEKLGISRRMSAFVSALGATVNMDGTAMYLALLTVFGAQLFGIPLDGADYVVIAVMASLGAVGAAGIPGGSVIFMPVVFGAVGVPLEVIAIVLGVDRLMDMARTVVNVVGDAVAAVAVAKWEGELDLTTYRTNKAPIEASASA
jgi:Na+/H+-dicarboxylate symporter